MACTRLSPRLNAAWCARLFSARDDRLWKLWKPALGGFQASVGRPVVHDAAAPTPRFSSRDVNNAKGPHTTADASGTYGCELLEGSNRVGRSDGAWPARCLPLMEAECAAIQQSTGTSACARYRSVTASIAKNRHSTSPRRTDSTTNAQSHVTTLAAFSTPRQERPRTARTRSSTFGRDHEGVAPVSVPPFCVSRTRGLADRKSLSVLGRPEAAG